MPFTLSGLSAQRNVIYGASFHSISRKLSRGLCRSFALAVSTPKKVKVRTHDDGVLDKLLHNIDESVSVATGKKSGAATAVAAFIFKVLVGCGYAGLVGDGEHAHPSA